MSDPSWNRTARWCSDSFLPCAKVFLALVIGFSALILPCVLWLQGLERFLEAGAAAILCSCSGVVALAASSWQTQLRQPLAGLLLAMALRSLPPLTVCLLLAIQGEGEQFIGFISYLLVFYLVTLSIETFLSVKLISRKQAH